MATGTQPGTVFVLKKDCTARTKEKTSSTLSKKGDEIHVLKGSLFEHGTDRSSNPKKISLHSCENPQVTVVCHVQDAEEISEEEYQLLIGISTCQDRLKVLDDKNWLAEGLHLKVGNIVSVTKQKGLPDNTDAVLRYKGQLPGLNGVQFGVELLSHRGHGTTDGVFRQKHYFTCEENCGLFISLNKIRLNKKANQPRSPPRENGVQNGLTHNKSLQEGDRIVWYSDSGPEHGVVKWIGILPDSSDSQRIAGVEFDNKIGTGNGKYKDRQLFKAKYRHASLVPIMGLIREDDFYATISSGCDSFTQYSPNGHHLSSNMSSRYPMTGVADIPGGEKAINRVIGDHKSQNNLYVQEQQKRILAEQQVHGTKLRKTSDNSSPSPTNKMSFGNMNGLSRQKNGYDTDEATKSTAYPARSGLSSAFDTNGPRYTTDSSRNIKYSTGKSTSPGIAPNAKHYNEREKLATGYSTLYGKSHMTPHRELADVSDSPLSGDFLPSLEQDIDVGSMVEVHGNPKKYGVVRWIGYLEGAKNKSKKVCGLEMEDEHPSYNNGSFGDYRYFECPDKRGLFSYLSRVRQDSRFIENPKYLARTMSLAFGSMSSPDVRGDLPPLSTDEDIQTLCGKHKGIQGHHNSCYLDSTLFTMFAFTGVFDSILYREPVDGDSVLYDEVQGVLKNSIVNPLRQNYFVRADKVVQLRTLLDKVGSVKGMMTEEKDPEEFLSLLLEKVMKADPFIRLSSGQESHFYQLFMEKDERLQLPTTQQLLELSFMQSEIKLAEVPSCLILQMPRFGKDYKMYQRIMPSLTLDITDVLEFGTRECTICGQVAEWECKQCYREWGDSLSKIAYCTQCNEKSHAHSKRNDHQPKELKIPEDFHMYHNKKNPVPREVMELFGVICIQTSHYVSFVKCGNGKNAKWVFFDSMADRMGEANGYNIPEVKPVPDLPHWLSESNIRRLSDIRDDKDIPDPFMRRLLCDAYVCLYQSTDISKFK